MIPQAILEYAQKTFGASEGNSTATDDGRASALFQSRKANNWLGVSIYPPRPKVPLMSKKRPNL